MRVLEIYPLILTGKAKSYDHGKKSTIVARRLKNLTGNTQNI
jgi:hypothetical protein